MEENPILAIKHDDLTATVKLRWLAAGLERVLRGIGTRLYETGVIDEVVNRDGFPN